MPFHVAAAGGQLGSMHMTPPPPALRDDFMDHWVPEGMLHAVGHGETVTLCGQVVDGTALRLFPSRVFHRDVDTAEACPACQRLARTHGGAG